MKSRDFCYWLQGLFEVAQPQALNAEAVAIIKAHLGMVFIHEIDPSFPASQKIDLDNQHVSNDPNKSPNLSNIDKMTMRC